MRHFLFHPPDAAGDKKMSRAAGWAPAGAARGMATTFYCGSFVEGKPKKLPTKFRYLFQAARRLKTATRTLVKELVTLPEDSCRLRWAAAFGIFSRLEVTHVNFLFLLFAHITFLSCVFGFGLCSRAE